MYCNLKHYISMNQIKSFHDQVRVCWNNFPTLYQRPEQILSHLFLSFGIGFEWNSGNWQEIANDQDVIDVISSYEDSAISMAKNDDRSFWFDYLLYVFKSYNELPNLSFGIHYSEYSALHAFPDDINKDWAQAILLCCDWIKSISFGEFCAFNRQSSCENWLGSSDKIEAGLTLRYPTLDKWQIRSKLADYIDVKVDEQLPIDWKNVRCMASNAKKRIKSLYPGLKGYEMPVLKRKIDYPKWYQGEFNFDTKSNQLLLPSWQRDVLSKLRIYPSEDEINQEQAMLDLTDKLLKNIDVKT